MAARNAAHIILSEFPGTRVIARRVRRAAVRTILDRHRQALSRQGDRELIHAYFVVHLSGERVDIAARAVMDNDANRRVVTQIARVDDAAEGDRVGALGLNVPELHAATVRVGEDTAPSATGDIGDVAGAQIARGRTDRTHCHTHTHCHGRDTGGPYTFADISFHLACFVWLLVLEFLFAWFWFVSLVGIHLPLRPPG